jgi:hypothetical protein
MSNYVNGICQICLNLRHECVCPEELVEDVVDLTPKRTTPAIPQVEKPMEKKLDTNTADFIKTYEERYPIMTAEFKKICSEQYVLFCQKNNNYGSDNIALGTNLSTPDEVKMSLSGIWFRMYDKFQRLKQLVLLGTSDQVGEDVGETFRDLSNYGVISQIILRGKWGK